MKEAEKEKLAEMLEDARSLFEGVQMDWHMGEEVGNEIERLKAIHTILNRIWPEIEAIREEHFRPCPEREAFYKKERQKYKETMSRMTEHLETLDEEADI